MLEAFCRPGEEYVVECGLTLRLKIVKFRQFRAWTPFFVQSLEAASNQIQFIVKRCLVLLALLRGEHIEYVCRKCQIYG